MKSILLKIWKALKLPTGLQLFAMRQINDQFLIGVTGIIFNNDGKILLVKHTYRDEDNWSLPGGYIKAKEHPKEELEREVEEECGAIISADRRLKIRTDRHSSRLDIVYVGTYMGGELKNSDETETAGFFNFNALPVLPKDQLIFIERAINEQYH